MMDPLQERAGEPSARVFGLPQIRVIGSDRPWVWLRAGWQDIRRAPAISMGFGSLVVAASYLLVAGLGSLGLEFLILPMAAGFMLVGPLLAAGLYEVSRRHERNLPATLESALYAYARNPTQIIAVGFILMLALLAWIRIALLLFALFFSDVPLSLDSVEFINRVFFSERTPAFLLTGTAVGSVLAFAVFSISAVSIPLLLDRDVGVIPAVVTSVAAVQRNFPVMMVWGGLIVLFTAAGMATGFFGLVITFPLIGHATWHAYRDLVVPESIGPPNPP